MPWHRQDRFLLGWLRSTITGLILSQYVSCKTSRDLWQSLHMVYSAISSARVMELCRLLQTTIRGGTPCNDYFERMRSIADQLAEAGDSVSDQDLVRYILNGLGPDFNSFVVTLITRATPVNLFELHAFLLTHKNLLNTQYLQQAAMVVHTTDPSASYASSGRGRGRGRKSNINFYSKGPVHQSGPSKPHLLPTSSQGPVSTKSGPVYQGHGRGASHQKSTTVRFAPDEDVPTCQICNKKGHGALICWYRYDDAYAAEPQPQTQAQAFVNTTTSSPSETWFLDSGATHHVTADINALSSSTPYVGHDTLQVGNGSNLPIHNLGHCVLSIGHCVLSIGHCDLHLK